MESRGITFLLAWGHLWKLARMGGCIGGILWAGASVELWQGEGGKASFLFLQHQICGRQTQINTHGYGNYIWTKCESQKQDGFPITFSTINLPRNIHPKCFLYRPFHTLNPHFSTPTSTMNQKRKRVFSAHPSINITRCHIIYLAYALTNGYIRLKTKSPHITTIHPWTHPPNP